MLAQRAVSEDPSLDARSGGLIRTILGTTYTSKLGRIIVGDSLRPCLGKGTSLGEEAVLADSGRAGEVATRVGRVRSLAFLNILRAVLPMFLMCGLLNFHCATIVFPQPVRPFLFSCACRHLLFGVSPVVRGAQNQQA